jgi:hypothetical protein
MCKLAVGGAGTGNKAANERPVASFRGGMLHAPRPVGATRN